MTTSTPSIDSSHDPAFYQIRLGCPADHAFVVDSWLQSDKSSDRAQTAGRVYFREQKKLIRLQLARPDSTLRIAHVSEDEDAILGWALVQLPFVVQYVYVKKTARKLGIARALLADLLDRDVEYAYRPIFETIQIPSSWIFNPYRSF